LSRAKEVGAFWGRESSGQMHISRLNYFRGEEKGCRRIPALADILTPKTSAFSLMKFAYKLQDPKLEVES